MTGGDDNLNIRGRLVRVGSLAADSFDHPVDVPGLVRCIRGRSLRVDVLTLVQTLPHTTPEHEYPMEWDNAAAVTVTTFDHWWNQQIDRKTRNIVRKSAKQGVAVRLIPFGDELVRAIHEIYNETAVRHGKAFWHYGKDLDTVRLENATFPDQSVFLAAFWGDRVVGFAKLVLANDRLQARLMQILSMASHRDKSPTNALIAEAVRYCADNGIGHLCYGKFTYGKKRRDSLTDFKENNGFQRIDVPRYYIPLTARGALAVRFGLHYRIADRIPEPLLNAYRDARRRWYARAGAH